MQKREEWLEEAMARYEQSLLRMCCAYLGDIALAEDAVQETFLKAWKRFDIFRSEANEKTWLTRIAINTCKDVRRSAYFRHVDRATALEDLDPYYFGMGGHSAETLDDGTLFTIDILPYPLIKDARGLDVLDISIGLNTYTRYLYFDGSLFYDLSGEKTENAAQMTATVARSDAEKRDYTAQTTWMGAKIKADALVSGTLGVITLRADEDVFEGAPLGSTWRMLVLDENGNVLEQADLFPVDQTGVARTRSLSHVIAVGQHLPEKMYVYPYYATQELPAQQVQETCEPIELTLQS